MTTPRLLLAASICVFLASCDDSSSSSGGGANNTAQSSALVGSWAYDSANKRTVQTFTTDRFHESRYLNKCLIQETWGGYTFDGSLVRATIDSGRMRSYFTMDNDSASTCAQEMYDGRSSGFLSYPIENVTATSFTQVSVWLSYVNGQQSSGTARHVFTKL